MKYFAGFVLGLIVGTAAISTAQWHDYQEEYRQQRDRAEQQRIQQYNQNLLNQFLLNQQFRKPC